ncbi:MAG: hypothetical protein Q4C87_02830 [Actinomycetaceae bacterium]|nr:hypothetical protein [Actinomycetaceae bacterium]
MTAPQQPQMSPDYVQQLRAAGVSEDQIRAMAQAQGATVPGQPQQPQQPQQGAGYGVPVQGAQQAVQQGYQSVAQGTAQGYQSFQQGFQGAAQGAAQGFQNAGANVASAAGQFAQGAARKVKGPSVFGSNVLRYGTSMLVLGLILGGMNIFNSLQLLLAGAPFLETYFYTPHAINMIQAWGSVILVPLGLILTIVGFLAGGRRR